jgi:hypothetical protein
MSKFVLLIPAPLMRVNPNSQRFVLLVVLWHHAMGRLLLKLDQLFVLLVPKLVVWFEATTASFPSEPDFVQESFSIESKFVCSTICPLITNPNP